LFFLLIDTTYVWAINQKTNSMELIINNLTKTYSNGVKALNGISLEISKGMFGLLGPNGAGKSTLMRTIATLQEADHGTITLGDIDVLKQKDTVRSILGYLPQEFGVYPKVSAEVLLNHLAVLKGLTNKNERKEIVQALLHKTNLYEHRKKNLGGFSGGMKQRFGIAEAITALEGNVYRKTITKQELQHYKQEYTVIADKFLSGKPVIHILSDTHPGNGFEVIKTDLEDVYFSHIFGDTQPNIPN